MGENQYAGTLDCRISAALRQPHYLHILLSAQPDDQSTSVCCNVQDNGPACWCSYFRAVSRLYPAKGIATHPACEDSRSASLRPYPSAKLHAAIAGFHSFFTNTAQHCQGCDPYHPVTRQAPMLLRVGATLSLVASACAQAGMLLAEVANLDLPHISAKAHACAWMLFFSELRQHGTALGVVDRLSYAKPHSPNAAPCCDRLRRSIVPRRFYAGKAL